MNSNKKVVHITTVHHHLDPRIYYKQCQSLQKAGFNVNLIVPIEKSTDLGNLIEIIPIKKYKNKLLRMIFSSFEAYKEARKLGADYIHIHDPELLPVAWLLKSKRNIVIYDIHEDYETSILQKDYLIKPLRKLIAKLYKFSETIFTKNIELCLAEKYYQENYPNGKCILNYPIINSTLINNQIEKEPLVNELIYTGNISVDRGAFVHAKLPLIDEKVSVYYYGKCPANLAERIIDKAGSRANKIFIEGIDRYIPKEEIEKNYIRQRWLAGIALFPPTEHYMKKELTKFFEYMSAGIPILCSDFPIWKQFVEKYECGLSVNPNDDNQIKEAIDYLRTNPNKAVEMGNNGKKAVIDHLNWEKEGKKLVEWYHKIGQK
jgi:glycosyltransferase involved in cell wall biosynthesis